jgi:uncharacterized membrane protein
MDSHKRSIAKAISYRTVSTLVTFAVSYLLTREIAIAAGISLSDTFIKVFLFYGHERLWEKINFGRKVAPPEDYTI